MAAKKKAKKPVAKKKKVVSKNKKPIRKTDVGFEREAFEQFF